MGNDLKYAEFGNQLQMTDQQQDEADVEGHQKDPQQRFVPENGRKHEGIVERPQPLGLFIRKNLQRGGMLGVLPDLNDSQNGPHQKDRAGDVNHRYQDEIDDGLHGSLLLENRSRRERR